MTDLIHRTHEAEVIRVVRSVQNEVVHARATLRNYDRTSVRWQGDPDLLELIQRCDKVVGQCEHLVDKLMPPHVKAVPTKRGTKP